MAVKKDPYELLKMVTALAIFSLLIVALIVMR